VRWSAFAREPTLHRVLPVASPAPRPHSPAKLRRYLPILQPECERVIPSPMLLILWTTHAPGSFPWATSSLLSAPATPLGRRSRLAGSFLHVRITSFSLSLSLSSSLSAFGPHPHCTSASSSPIVFRDGHVHRRIIRAICAFFFPALPRPSVGGFRDVDPRPRSRGWQCTVL